MFDRWKAYLRAPEAKASRTAQLLAFDGGGRARWTPKDFQALAREGYLANAIVHRAVRLIAENAAAYTSTIITFTLFEAAYFSEIMRAGIQSVPRGQVQAGYAIGLNYRDVMRYVVLPQAFRNMLPVIFTQTIVLFQDTSLVYVLSIPDFLGAASKVAQRDGRLVEMYLFAALVYFVISCVASFGVRRLQARIAIVR